jgi:hypothetical protein
MITMTKTMQVDESDLSRCHRLIYENTGEVFYLVESKRDPLVEYRVRALEKGGRYYLTCTCPAGQAGRACWHKRAAFAHAQEYKAAHCVASRLEVVDRHEQRSLTHFAVREGQACYSVYVHKGGDAFCYCQQPGANGAMPYACKHLAFVRNFEQAFHKELAHYLAETRSA